MHIALVSQEFPPETAHGGIATQSWAKAHGLAALGHRVTVVSHSIDGTRSVRRHGAVEVVRIPGYDGELPLGSEIARWISYSLLVATEIARLRQASEIDIIDFPDWGCEAYLHLLNRSDDDPLPVIIHLHGPLVMLAATIGWPEPGSALLKIGRQMEDSCLRLADAIVSSSRCSANWISRGHGIDSSAIPIIHCGIDTVHFSPDPALPGDPTIVFVGRVDRSKGVETLVDAACEVARSLPRLRLRLIGRADQPMRDALLQRSLAAGQRELIEFRGQVAAADLPDELRRAQVFALPSRYEGGPGLACLEAMACGLPVVVSSGSGLAEVVRDGETGLAVPPGDSDALARCLQQLLQDGGMRRRLGAAAREYAVAEADTRVCMRRFETFLRGIVERRPR